MRLWGVTPAADTSASRYGVRPAGSPPCHVPLSITTGAGPACSTVTFASRSSGAVAIQSWYAASTAGAASNGNVSRKFGSLLTSMGRTS